MSELSNYWTLWYHSLDDNDWTVKSYIKVFKFNKLEEWFDLSNQIKNFTYGMFFLMKNDILPCWEDDNNINGGYWSFKVYKVNSNDAWIQLSFALIGNTICNNEDELKYINGISISPKYNYCIIKILNNDMNFNNKQILIDSINDLKIDHCIYKKYQELDNKNIFIYI